MQALVLAGGFGTRLRSVIGDCPKVLAPINGRPFMDYQMAYLRKQGIERVILCIGFLSDQVITYIREIPNYGMEIQIVVEDKPLGTGGAVRNALDHTEVENRFVCVNGDTFIKWQLGSLREKHEVTGAGATLLLAPNPNPSTASVMIDNYGQIVKYAEKTADENLDGIPLASAGIYLVERRIVSTWPTGPNSLEFDCFPKLAARGDLYGEVTEEVIYDIGTPEGLLRFERKVITDEMVTRVNPTGQKRLCNIVESDSAKSGQFFKDEK